MTPTVWGPLLQSPLKANASVCPCPCATVTPCAAPSGLPSTVTVNCASPWAAVSDKSSTSVSAPVPTGAGVVPAAAVPGPTPDGIVPPLEPVPAGTTPAWPVAPACAAAGWLGVVPKVTVPFL